LEGEEKKRMLHVGRGGTYAGVGDLLFRKGRGRKGERDWRLRRGGGEGVRLLSIALNSIIEGGRGGERRARFNCINYEGRRRSIEKSRRER